MLFMYDAYSHRLPFQMGWKGATFFYLNGNTHQFYTLKCVFRFWGVTRVGYLLLSTFISALQPQTSEKHSDNSHFCFFLQNKST